MSNNPMRATRQAIRVRSNRQATSRLYEVHGFQQLDAEHTARLAKCVFEGWGLLYGDRALYPGASASYCFIPFNTCPILIFVNA